MSIAPRPHRMEIQVRGTGKDSFGGQVETWTPVVTVYCAIRPLSGRALETAQQVYGQVSHEIRMAYRTGITQAHRGVYHGRYFDFESIINVEERNMETRIMACEGTATG